MFEIYVSPSMPATPSTVAISNPSCQWAQGGEYHTIRARLKLTLNFSVCCPASENLISVQLEWMNNHVSLMASLVRLGYSSLRRQRRRRRREAFLLRAVALTAAQA
jgi:hypothetical protein